MNQSKQQICSVTSLPADSSNVYGYYYLKSQLKPGTSVGTALARDIQSSNLKCIRWFHWNVFPKGVLAIQYIKVKITKSDVLDDVSFLLSNRDCGVFFSRYESFSWGSWIQVCKNKTNLIFMPFFLLMFALISVRRPNIRFISYICDPKLWGCITDANLPVTQHIGFTKHTNTKNKTVMGKKSFKPGQCFVHFQVKLQSSWPLYRQMNCKSILAIMYSSESILLVSPISWYDIRL